MPMDLLFLYLVGTITLGSHAFVRAFRGFPPPPSGDHDLDAVQRAHDRSHRVVLALQGLAIVAYVYALGRSFDLPFPFEVAPIREYATLLLMPLVGMWLGAFLGFLLRRGAGVRLVRARPEYAEGLPPFFVEFLPLLVAALWVGSVALAFELPGLWPVAAVYASTILVGWGQRAIAFAMARRYQRPLDPDSDLARGVADLARRFGVPEGRYVETRSLVANAWAAPDGRLYLTTSLRRLVGDAGTLALLAHEFEHLRVGDYRTFPRRRATALVLLGAASGAIAVVPIAFHRGHPLWAVATVALGGIVLSPLFLLPWARASRARGAGPPAGGRAAAGRGASATDRETFAAALVAIYRWHGIPPNVRTLTYPFPPLETRLAAISRGSGVPPSGDQDQDGPDTLGQDARAT